MNKIFLCSIMFFAIIFSAVASESNVDTAWNNALQFLQKEQAEDGSFGMKKGTKVGVTALVLQAWNEAPAQVKEKNPAFKTVVSKSANWIAAQQLDSGAISDGPQYHNYTTSLAVQALSEYDANKYAPVLTKATTYILGIQANKNKEYDPKKHITFGGFGYGSTLRPDLSNTWFSLGALSSAKIPESNPVWQDALVFLKRCQNSTEVNDQAYAGNDGGAMYLPDNSTVGKEKTREGKEINKSFGSMTCALIGSYLMAGEKADSLPVKLAVKWLADNWSVVKNPAHNKDGLQAKFYYYRALAKALSLYEEKGGDFKKLSGHDWRAELSAELLKTQTKEGYWVNKAARFSENDPVLCTGYALTALGLCSEK